MMRKLLLLAALGLVTAAPVRAADVTILGCNERLAGEIGVREVLADVGDTVEVAVTVNTVGNVAVFGLDIAFPTNLLSFVRADPGELTSGWTLLRGDLAPSQSVVKIGGYKDGTPIPAGTTGRLAVMVFEVIAAGSGSFSTVALVDDLSGYTPCESVHTPTKVHRRTWGAVKELYR
jgi:hypothetical protein